jgi:U3 small nucleolar RNA-associated protein 10
MLALFLSRYCQSHGLLFCSKVQAGALDVLADRLASVTNEVRHAITPTIIKILAQIQQKLPVHKGGPLASASFKAVKAIAQSMCPGEEGPLAACISVILAAIRDRIEVASAVQALVPLSYVLFSDHIRLQ